MRELTFNTDEGEYTFTNSELIEHLQADGYVVLGDGINSLDLIDAGMLEEIENLFFNSSCAKR